MKKIFLICLLLGFSSVQAYYPVINGTVGGIQPYMDFTDANDRPVSLRMEPVEKIQSEYKIKQIKRPAKIDLNSYRVTPEETDFVPKPVELIQQDGKFFIQNIK